MLIKKVLNDYYHSRNSSRVKLIAIPNGFGKSTIVDMVKRFAEIVVDNDGNRIGLNETDNYRLFCKQSEPLKICREQSFVAEHMGRYPVVRIDYNQLRNVIDFESLLAAVRNLLSAVYSEHKYLLNVKRLWSQTFLFTRKTFHEYIDLRVRLPQSVIKNGFKLLTIILSVNFGKNTIDLITTITITPSTIIITMPVNIHVFLYNMKKKIISLILFECSSEVCKFHAV